MNCPELSVIVPTYHEAANLPTLLTRIAEAMSVAGITFEVIVVDDDSRDGTEELCDRFGRFQPVRLIVRKDRRGLSSAVLEGIRAAGGDVVCVIDADLSHPPERIAAMHDQLLGRGEHCSDCQMVIGSRYVAGGSTTRNWGVGRWLNSKLATWAARLLTSVADPMAGFFMLRRRDAVRADHLLDPIGYKIGLEILTKCGFDRVGETPIRFCNRVAGESKLNIKQQWLYGIHLNRLMWFKFGKSAMRLPPTRRSAPALINMAADERSEPVVNLPHRKAA